jgi:hypothetical protein
VEAAGAACVIAAVRLLARRPETRSGQTVSGPASDSGRSTGG